MTTQNAIAREPSSTVPLVVFSLTLFVSAALLFLLEPLFAKLSLPVLGGSSAVWTTCMLFYQAALLAGYAFANAIASRAGFRRQAILWIALSLAPLLLLPFQLPAGRVPPVDRNPIPWLLLLIASVVGIPFFVLSTISPTLQKWFARIGHPLSDDPYFLYGASNLGSMLGLLSYPILVEPNFSLATQSRLWKDGYILLIALVILCATIFWREGRDANPTQSARSQSENEPTPSAAARTESDSAAAPSGQPSTQPSTNPSPSYAERFRWLALAFVPASLMLGVTTVLTTEIPPIPLFWVLPLAIYLLSFILVFAKKPPISHKQVAMRMPFAILSALIPLLVKADWPLFLEIFVYLAVLFVVAVSCHGELARRRPPTEHLTNFYLWIAGGGALAGVFNALVAPLIFKTVLEFPVALICAALLRTMFPGTDKQRFDWRDIALPCAAGALVVGLVFALTKFGLAPGVGFHFLAFGPSMVLCLSFAKRPVRFALGIVALLIASTFYTGAFREVLHTERSFYGIYRIANDESGQYRLLFDGRTIHGIQSLDPSRRRQPVSYYTRTGPAGQVFRVPLQSQEAMNVAIVGLGAGSLACYARPDDTFTFFEIDPVVVNIARDPRYFTYMRDCGSTDRVILGDARISLKNAADHGYTMIILDAFGADAIPVHLLTRDAVVLYLAKLKDHGILLFHISNRYLELQKVLGNIAGDLALVSYVQDDTSEIGGGKLPSRWVVMAQNEDDLGAIAHGDRWLALTKDPHAKTWTDDFSSLFTVFNWN